MSEVDPLARPNQSPAPQEVQPELTQDVEGIAAFIAAETATAYHGLRIVSSSIKADMAEGGNSRAQAQLAKTEADYTLNGKKRWLPKFERGVPFRNDIPYKLSKARAKAAKKAEKQSAAQYNLRNRQSELDEAAERAIRISDSRNGIPARPKPAVEQSHPTTEADFMPDPVELANTITNYTGDVINNVSRYIGRTFENRRPSAEEYANILQSAGREYIESYFAGTNPPAAVKQAAATAFMASLEGYARSYAEAEAERAAHRRQRQARTTIRTHEDGEQGSSPNHQSTEGRNTQAKTPPEWALKAVKEARKLGVLVDADAPSLLVQLKQNDEMHKTARRATLGLPDGESLPPDENKKVLYKSRTEIALRNLEAVTGEKLDEQDERVKALAQALVAMRELERSGVDISDLSKLS